MAAMTSTATNLPRSSMGPPPAYSPLSSAGSTPSTASPTSPRQPHANLLGSQHLQQPHPATRQLRPPKSPLYVPAALRPTERPVKSKAPPTPPQSSHASSDSLAGAGGKRHTRNTSQGSTPRPHPPSPPTVSTGGLTRSYSTTSSIFSSAPPSPSTSAYPPPTRAHWKPDALATRCDAPGCGLVFSLLARRHHCRRCGGVFCAQHSSCQVPLDEDAGFDERGGWWRACDKCGDLWADRVEELMKKGVEGGSAVHVERDGDNGKVVPIGAKAGENGGEGNVAASVPKDWSWSTF